MRARLTWGPWSPPSRRSGSTTSSSPPWTRGPHSSSTAGHIQAPSIFINIRSRYKPVYFVFTRLKPLPQQIVQLVFADTDAVAFFAFRGSYRVPLIVFQFLMSLLIEGRAIMCIKFCLPDFFYRKAMRGPPSMEIVIPVRSFIRFFVIRIFTAGITQRFRITSSCSL